MQGRGSGRGKRQEEIWGRKPNVPSRWQATGLQFGLAEKSLFCTLLFLFLSRPGFVFYIVLFFASLKKDSATTSA